MKKEEAIKAMDRIVYGLSFILLQINSGEYGDCRWDFYCSSSEALLFEKLAAAEYMKREPWQQKNPLAGCFSSARVGRESEFYRCSTLDIAGLEIAKILISKPDCAMWLFDAVRKHLDVPVETKTEASSRAQEEIILIFKTVAGVLSMIDNDESMGKLPKEA